MGLDKRQQFLNELVTLCRKHEVVIEYDEGEPTFSARWNDAEHWEISAWYLTMDDIEKAIVDSPVTLEILQDMTVEARNAFAHEYNNIDVKRLMNPTLECDTPVFEHGQVQMYLDMADKEVESKGESPLSEFYKSIGCNTENIDTALQTLAARPKLVPVNVKYDKTPYCKKWYEPTLREQQEATRGDRVKMNTFLEEYQGVWQDPSNSLFSADQLRGISSNIPPELMSDDPQFPPDLMEQVISGFTETGAGVPPVVSTSDEILFTLSPIFGGLTGDPELDKPFYRRTPTEDLDIEGTRKSPVGLSIFPVDSTEPQVEGDPPPMFHTPDKFTFPVDGDETEEVMYYGSPNIFKGNMTDEEYRKCCKRASATKDLEGKVWNKELEEWVYPTQNLQTISNYVATLDVEFLDDSELPSQTYYYDGQSMVIGSITKEQYQQAAQNLHCGEVVDDLRR